MRFKIEFVPPGEEKSIVEFLEFDDAPSGVCPNTGFQYPAIGALSWAEDYAYTKADKCQHKVTPIP